MAFVAPAWKGTPTATAERARELMPSGIIQWGLDETEHVFSLFEVPYQPVTVLIRSGGTIFDRWVGLRDAGEIRSALDALVAEG